MAAGALLAVTLLLLLPLARPLRMLHPSSQTLQVRTIQLVDRRGAVRLRIGVAADDTPSVRLYDNAGTRRLELAVGADGPVVTMFDERGVERRMFEAGLGLEPSSEDEAAGP